LCVPPSSVVPDVDAGKCLGIYYATVAHVVLWIDDVSVPGGGARVTLTKVETKTEAPAEAHVHVDPLGAPGVVTY
jgi:hypothetical protein